MKAWVLEQMGDISLQEKSLPDLREVEVRVQVKATGICGSDIPRIYETGAHRMPLIPGHEFAGIVDEVSKDVPISLIGKRVAVYPKIPCGNCAYCRRGDFSLCKDYDYIGSRRDGAFAEYVCVPAVNLIELPDNVSMESAAMIEPLAVAANAVRTACHEESIDIDKPVAVCGMGTIGLMVVLFLKNAGFSNIYVIGNREDQREKAISIGIESEHYFNIKEADPVAWLKERTGGVGLYFECVGSNDSIRYGLEAGAPGAVMMMVGNPRSDMSFSRDVFWQIPRNQMKLVGIWNSVFWQGMPGEAIDEARLGTMDRKPGQRVDDWRYVLSKLESGEIDPSGLITHRLRIDELERGFLIMRDKTEDYTKVMMVNE